VPQQTAWTKANAYQDVGKITPGVTAVRYTEKTETRQVIELDVKILWKKLHRSHRQVRQQVRVPLQFRANSLTKNRKRRKGLFLNIKIHEFHLHLVGLIIRGKRNPNFLILFY
jgi:hypothetical protein